MSTRIYIAMHHSDDHVMRVPRESIYIPIHAGKAIYKPEKDPYLREFMPALGDDTGDNISSMNPYYCELTVLYWVWKNDSSGPDDVVGLNHYRRYFCEFDTEKNEILSEETINDILSKYDFIVSGSSSDYDEECEESCSVYKSYKDNHVIEDLDESLMLISQFYPQLYSRMEREIKKTDSMALCNMMICKKKHLDQYCEFLFTIFNKLEQIIDLNDDKHQGYNGRVFGFLGERLFRPWIMATGHTCKSVPSLNWEQYSDYEWE